MSYIETQDPDIKLAERVIQNTYGDTVSVTAKKKFLNKFGTNDAVGTSEETVAQFQGATGNETFVTTNIIDSIVSSSASDTTQTIVIEGHTLDASGNLTFVTQEAVLTGQTAVLLSTPLARCNRMVVKETGTPLVFPDALVGDVVVYDNTGGISGGVPVVPAATKCLIEAGSTQSEKCATSISSTDYWLISEAFIGVGVAGGAADRVLGRIQMRNTATGGAWRPIGSDIVVSVGQNPQLINFKPFLIVPKNNDVRMVARTNASSAAVYAEINGYLALVTS